MPRLLFVGDIHLGRRPTKLPDELPGLRPADLGPAAAWRATVAHALAERVDAVVLAGDVVESLGDRFEAYGHLQSGVARLTEAGIPVIGVAGNHDVLALPHLAQQVPGFQLLGAGGTWAHADVKGADGATVRLLGWSFPAEKHRRDPLDGFQVPGAEGLAVLGVLHCDLDGPPTSPYAPVRRADLERQSVDAWLLGHVHRPSNLSGARPIGYLGSLSALDPGEPGAHGPWMVQVEGPGRVRATQVPLAPMRYEQRALDVSEVGADGALAPEAALERAVLATLAEVAAECDAEDAQAKLVACRLTLKGRTAHHAELSPGPSTRASRRSPRATAPGGSTWRRSSTRRRRPSTSRPSPGARAPPSSSPGAWWPWRPGATPRPTSCAGPASASRPPPPSPPSPTSTPTPLDDDALRRHLLRAGREALERLLAQKEDR